MAIAVIQKKNNSVMLRLVNKDKVRNSHIMEIIIINLIVAKKRKIIICKSIEKASCIKQSLIEP